MFLWKSYPQTFEPSPRCSTIPSMSRTTRQSLPTPSSGWRWLTSGFSAFCLIFSATPNQRHQWFAFGTSHLEPTSVWSLLQVDSRATSIAWAGDVNRFVNLDPEAQISFRWSLMWWSLPHGLFARRWTEMRACRTSRMSPDSAIVGLLEELDNLATWYAP